MPIKLETNAREEGTYFIDCAFTDEDDQPVIPDSIKWSLMDRDGNYINNRQDITASPATSITIVLSGPDLALPDPKDFHRIVLLEAIYTSSLGPNLPLRGAVEFSVEDI